MKENEHSREQKYSHQIDKKQEYDGISMIQYFFSGLAFYCMLPMRVAKTPQEIIKHEFKENEKKKK